MKKLILILFLILIACQKSNQVIEVKNTNETSVTDSDIYEIVNLVLYEYDEASKRDGFKENWYKYVLDRDLEPLFTHNDSIVLIETDTLFTKEDLKFIEKQIFERKDFKFQTKFLKSKKVIRAEIIRNMIDSCYKYNYSFPKAYLKKFGNDRHYTIGLPVFSKDKKTVFLKIDSYGSGTTMIFKKVNNKWKYYCSTGSWIA